MPNEMMMVFFFLQQVLFKQKAFTSGKPAFAICKVNISMTKLMVITVTELNIVYLTMVVITMTELNIVYLAMIVITMVELRVY